MTNNENNIEIKKQKEADKYVKVIPNYLRYGKEGRFDEALDAIWKNAGTIKRYSI